MKTKEVRKRKRSLVKERVEVKEEKNKEENIKKVADVSEGKK